MRLVLVAGVFALLVLVLAAGRARAASGACTGSTQVTCVFSYTGGSQAWTVPAGITQATFTLYGAEGGGASPTPAGVGAEVSQTLALTPGTVLQVNAGGAGTRDGAFGGGAGGGNGGGGASDVRSPAAAGSYPLADRLLVAGGGGGRGLLGDDTMVEYTPIVQSRVQLADSTAPIPPGPAGGNAGSPGSNGGWNFYPPGAGGGAGTITGPGGGGAGGINGNPGASGSLGAGGAGGNGGGMPGGGGGGGYYGGGGGGTGGTMGTPLNDPGTTIMMPDTGDSGGGGGGSSYPASASMTNGVPAPDDAPNGEVIVSYTRIATSTALSSSANPSWAGQQVAYTAKVTPAADSGTVAFTDGGGPISGCTAQPVSTSTGAASCTVTYTTAGSHAIGAVYSGDGSFAPSSSATLTQQVQAQTATSTALSSNANTTKTGTPASYSATVTPAPDGGTVTFTDGGTPIPGCIAQLVNGQGIAGCRAIFTAAGSHTIKATYSGDAAFTASTSPTLTEVVIS